MDTISAFLGWGHRPYSHHYCHILLMLGLRFLISSTFSGGADLIYE